MKRKSIKLYLVLSMLIVLGWSITAFTQQNAFDQQRMNKDLRIMEGILDKLLQGNISVYYNVSGRTKAVYLPEFGIVFNIKQGLFSSTIFNENMQQQENHIQEILNHLEHNIQEREMEINTGVRNEFQTEQQIELDRSEMEKITEAMNAYSNQLLQKQEKIIDELKENITVFFSNYVSAIGQLQSQDKLVVLVDLKNSQPRDSGNDILIGWVLKQDVDRYRQGQIDESGFEGRVYFQFADTESDIDTDIGILLEIFDRAMDSSPYWGNSISTGVYLEGLGALIFMEIPRTISFGSAINVYNNYILNEGRVLLREENGRPIAYNWEGQRLGEVAQESDDQGSEDEDVERANAEIEYIESVQNELFELLASYGHTLRLPSQEWVILNANLGSRFIGFTNEEKTPSFFILKLKKKDLDDYNRGAITLSTLKGRLVQ